MVDVDLGRLGGAGASVSRLQAYLALVPSTGAAITAAMAAAAAARGGGGGGAAEQRQQRRQSLLALPTAAWELTNVGRGEVRVNGARVPPGATCPVPHLSLLEFGGGGGGGRGGGDEAAAAAPPPPPPEPVRLLFLVNAAASARVAARTAALIA